MVSGAAAGAGRWAGVTSAVFYYPLAVADRVINAARVCVAFRFVEVAGDVLAEVLHTVRHTADSANDVAHTAGETLKWTIGIDAAARLTAFAAAAAQSSVRYLL